MEEQGQGQELALVQHQELALVQQALDEAIKGASPPIAHVLQYFRFRHLPLRLQSMSGPFCGLAVMVASNSSNPETTMAIRKLLEAKDAAVRSML